MAKTKEKKEPNVVLSLVNYNDMELGVAVTSDPKELADGIYSFLTMCMNHSIKNVTDEHARGIMIGVGEWLTDLPIDESTKCLHFFAECVSAGVGKMKENKKCDC